MEEIPPLYQRTFQDTLDLLELTARGEVGAEHERRGLIATTTSTTHPCAKAAYGMFHLRQTAAVLAAWKAPAGEHAIGLAGTSPAAARLFEDLAGAAAVARVTIASAPAPVSATPANSIAAQAPGAAVMDCAGEARAPGSTVLVGLGEARLPEEIEVSPPLEPPRPGADSICWPVAGGPFVELRAARGTRSALAQALQAAGFQVALSKGRTPARTSSSERCWRRWRRRSRTANRRMRWTARSGSWGCSGGRRR